LVKVLEALEFRPHQGNKNLFLVARESLAVDLLIWNLAMPAEGNIGGIPWHLSHVPVICTLMEPMLHEVPQPLISPISPPSNPDRYQNCHRADTGTDGFPTRFRAPRWRFS